MKFDYKTKNWWGSPKKFSIEYEERKISWLELFYDLVYVLAIAKITSQLSENISTSTLLKYGYYFFIIYWSWLNGSLYYDMHGSEGLRTRLMTLWQMLFVAALIITLGSTHHAFQNSLIVLLILQLYIIYLWWSVGYYDKEHRKLSQPYTISFLVTFCLMFMALYLPESIRFYVLYLSIITNCIPPYIMHLLMKDKTKLMVMSSSMVERLGLITIILFGEVIAGIIIGADAIDKLSVEFWVDFGLAVITVFSLWWIFFTLISDRKCKQGIVSSTNLELLYFPTLMSLGILGMSFNVLFRSNFENHHSEIPGSLLLGISIAVFLLGITVMLFILDFDPKYRKLKKRVQIILFSTSIVIGLFAIIAIQLSLTITLLFYLGVVLILILLLNYSWYMVVYSKS